MAPQAVLSSSFHLIKCYLQKPQLQLRPLRNTASPGSTFPCFSENIRIFACMMCQQFGFVPGMSAAVCRVREKDLHYAIPSSLWSSRASSWKLSCLHCLDSFSLIKNRFKRTQWVNKCQITVIHAKVRGGNACKTHCMSYGLLFPAAGENQILDTKTPPGPALCHWMIHTLQTQTIKTFWALTR